MSVHPSILLPVLPIGCFLRMVSLIFSKFWHGARIPIEVVRDRFFCLQNWENGPKVGQKQVVFFYLLENLILNFYWIWSIMNMYIIYFVPEQIPYLGKFLFLRYGPKCSQPIRLQDFLINHISRTNQLNSLIFACWYKIHLNIDQKIFGWEWSKMGVASLVTEL